ncbi:biotin-dependent carboxyltransferase family protein [Staphylococcus hominis]|uniref:5-oxoprolinase subunit C family protein n=1 Tax=Staphylococcus hominis TaxID=1290 RepID=UPI003DA0CB4E
MSISIIQPGMFTTVQDEGRFGFQHLGFSSAGAMDLYSYLIGKSLIGNNGPSIEYTIIGPTLQFNKDNTFILTGAHVNAKLNEETVDINTVIYACKGDILKVGAVTAGARGYIFFGHPLDIQPIAESYSTHTRSKIGGYKGRPLSKGDLICLKENPSFKQNLGKTTVYNAIPEDNIIHIITGPQIEAFSKESINKLVNMEYKVSEKSDRMGYRLNGECIPPKTGADIISEPVALGSIQVPNDGNPIILLNDKQTIGGYTKIATVTQLDLNKIAQFKPGDLIRFKWSTIEEATKAQEQYLNHFNHLKTEINTSPTFNMSEMRPTAKKLTTIITEER